MSTSAWAVSALLAVVIGAAMTMPINWYLARLHTEGIRARPAQAWAVAVTTGAAVALATVGADDGWEALPLAVAAVGLAAVSVTDVRAYRIANRILYPAGAVTVAVMAAVAGGPGEPADLARAVIGAAVFCAILLVIALVAPAGGMGLGDVKLAVVLGLAVGWVAGNGGNVAALLVWAMLLSSLFGVVGGLALAIARRVTGKNLLPDPDADPAAPAPPLLRTPFPFGPGLVLGTLLVVGLRDSFLR